MASGSVPERGAVLGISSRHTALRQSAKRTVAYSKPFTFDSCGTPFEENSIASSAHAPSSSVHTLCESHEVSPNFAYVEWNATEFHLQFSKQTYNFRICTCRYHSNRSIVNYWFHFRDRVQIAYRLLLSCVNFSLNWIHSLYSTRTCFIAYSFLLYRNL